MPDRHTIKPAPAADGQPAPEGLESPDGHRSPGPELPPALRQAIDRRAAAVSPPALAAAARAVSKRYQAASRSGSPLVTDATEALAYAAARMPATYAAVRAAMNMAFARTRRRPASLLDAGAGTGAAAWAAASLFSPERVVCLEPSPAMRDLGRELAAEAAGEIGPFAALAQAQWRTEDLTAPAAVATGSPGRFDLVTAAYMLNELPPGGFEEAVGRLWAAAGSVLLLVEPGTPAGSTLLREARRFLLAQGARTLAPCPHDRDCPLEDGDWCHFSVRLPRGRRHRALKGGNAPYEDEKFSCLAVLRPEDGDIPAGPPFARVLRHPRRDKGRVTLRLCAADGVREETVRKRDAAYTPAKKLSWGDAAEAESGFNL